MLRTLVLFLICGSAVGQQATPNYVVRIREFRLKQIGCAVLTSDGKVHWEVTHIWPSEPPQMYEGAATEQDHLAVKDLLGKPELQQANANTIPNGRVGPDGRMVTIEFVNGGKPVTSVFLDQDGRISAPEYIRQALDFSKELSKRKLAKLPRSTPTLCPAASVR